MSYEEYESGKIDDRTETYQMTSQRTSMCKNERPVQV